MSIRSIGDDDEEQGRWENLPQELIRIILIKIVRWGETFPPERAFLILPFASVCKSWRVVAKEIVKSIPELSQQLIFPISLKQVINCVRVALLLLQMLLMYFSYHKSQIGKGRRIGKLSLSKYFNKRGLFF